MALAILISKLCYVYILVHIAEKFEEKKTNFICFYDKPTFVNQTQDYQPTVNNFSSVNES